MAWSEVFSVGAWPNENFAMMYVPLVLVPTQSFPVYAAWYSEARFATFCILPVDPTRPQRPPSIAHLKGKDGWLEPEENPVVPRYLQV